MTSWRPSGAGGPKTLMTRKKPVETIKAKREKTDNYPEACIQTTLKPAKRKKNPTTLKKVYTAREPCCTENKTENIPKMYRKYHFTGIKNYYKKKAVEATKQKTNKRGKNQSQRKRKVCTFNMH
jgi:hypothetical protein